MILNRFKLFQIVASKVKGKTHPPEAHSIIAEVAGIGKEGNEAKEPGTMSARLNERKQRRVTRLRCLECGWSKS